MKFYSIEWLADGQIKVEDHNGIVVNGTPAEILPQLKSTVSRRLPWEIIATVSADGVSINREYGIDVERSVMP